LGKQGLPTTAAPPSMRIARMAASDAQRRWRQKNRFVKTQLNVMVRRLVHDDLNELAQAFELRGKAEAVSLASFIAKGLLQSAEHDESVRQLIERLREIYARDRDLYA
jgi:hypothetical protein